MSSAQNTSVAVHKEECAITKNFVLMSISIINKVIKLFNVRRYINKYNKDQNKRVRYIIRKEILDNCTLNSTKPGISNTKYCEHDIIVSLTTFGKRLYDVSTTIESIMQGTMHPNRIILWLEEGLKGVQIPNLLKMQQKRGLEIKYYKDIRSYKKIIPTFINYPENIVITIDDDVIYQNDLVENLYNTHLDYPNCICANRIHRIKLDKTGKPIGYKDWVRGKAVDGPSPLNFMTGVGGVLYPPHCFDEEVLNENVFTKICPYADDIWLFSMALKKGTRIVKGFTHNKIGEDYLANMDVQDDGLYRTLNEGQNLNDKQLRNVFEKYKLYTLLTNY